MAASLILLVLTVLVALLLIPSFVASAKRKRAGETDEVLYSDWRDWNGDGSFFNSDDPAAWDETEPVEPVYGVIRLQAR